MPFLEWNWSEIYGWLLFSVELNIVCCITNLGNWGGSMQCYSPKSNCEAFRIQNWKNIIFDNFFLWRGDLFSCLLKAHWALKMKHKIALQYKKWCNTPTCNISVLDYSIIWNQRRFLIFVYIFCTNVTLTFQPTSEHLTCELRTWND